MIERYASLLLIFACLVAPTALKADETADKVEKAHGIGSWWKTQVLKADAKVIFGNKTALEGTIWMETNGPKTRLELADGQIIVFDGQDCWLHPGGADPGRARFHALTWSWFVMAPFKVQGDGTHLTPWVKSRWNGKTYLTSRQTFGAGEGDSPDDWYHLYVDPKTHLLAGMGYIVTFGKSKEEAESDPHGIVYHDYVDVAGAKISTRWSFGHFSEAEGIHGEIGSATIGNLSFIAADERLFYKPGNAVKVLPPEVK